MRDQERAARSPGGGSPFGFADSGPDPAAAIADAERLLLLALRTIGLPKADLAPARAQAELTLSLLDPLPVCALVRAVEDLLLRFTDTAARGGWGPADLGELVRRRVGPRCVPALVGVLSDYAAREAWTRTGWAAELAGLGRGRRPAAFDTVEGLALALQVAALLAVVPTVEGPTTPTASGAAHPKLARVRALLAKAESTEYDEEAEALSAKAQELISRYALERLLQRDSRGDEAGSGVTRRRIWLDAPYVLAKATLVDEVATANRCRSVLTESLGFCLVVGDAGDLEAVELLVTSLLVQANTAMVRLGSRVDRRGASRTRSFRQSFLLAYARRIGERLREAGAEAVHLAGGEERLLPVLRDQETRVADALAAMLPHVSTRSTTVSNHEGWVAGQVAADQALLDVHSPITRRR